MRCCDFCPQNPFIGSIERYKARLVARGFTQTRGVDFNETFAPVTRLDTLRLLVANAVQHNWEFRQIDVKTAYLYGDLDEEVYMDVPQGLENVPENHVLKLEKALYGLKQAGRQWYHALHGVMMKFGMKRIPSDPHTFLYTKGTGATRRTLIVPVYVDDLFPFGDKKLVEDFENHIPQYFETSTPCDAHYFLGIRVTRNRTPENTRPYISLDQITFIQNVLVAIPELFDRRKVTPRQTVLPVAAIVPNKTPKNLAEKSYVRRFQSAVGQLMYIMLATRPDLSYPVGMLARHAANPSPQHEDALFHLLGYLQHTVDDVLVYRKPNNDDSMAGLMECYTDADWAGEEHSGRSTSGMVVCKNNSTIAWNSKRQGVVSTSTMEAEYIAMFSTVQNAVWLSRLEDQLFAPNSRVPNIRCDNQAAITIATGSDLDFKRSRFMNVKYHYVRQQVEEDRITIEYVKSENNAADLFTKRLPKATLKRLRTYFMESYSRREVQDDSDDESSTEESE